MVLRSSSLYPQQPLLEFDPDLRMGDRGDWNGLCPARLPCTLYRMAMVRLI